MALAESSRRGLGRLLFGARNLGLFQSFVWGSGGGGGGGVDFFWFVGVFCVGGVDFLLLGVD